jgi:TonB-linked SusC/RagA family outer membrane protein
MAVPVAPGNGLRFKIIPFRTIKTIKTMNLYVKKHIHMVLCFVRSQWQHGFLRTLKTKALLMRASILVLLLSANGLLIAGTGNSQDLDKVIVSVEFKNASLKAALQKIEKLTQLPFTYKTSDISPYDNIYYQANGISLTKVLDDLLKSTELRYELVNSNIVIKKIRKSEIAGNANPVISATEFFDGVIRGKITDEKGNPVPNASIQLSGSNKGTAANSNGDFIITGVAAGNYRLRISAIGYEDQIKEVSVKDNEDTQVSFQLKDKNSDLTEVVVTALGISRKERSLGYSTQQVKGDNLTLTKEQNVLGSLAGKIAGVQVTGSSGASMGGTQKIKIRGVNSIAGTDQPLIVVDGTPISNANFAGSDKADFGNLGQDVNPEDIESVNVLKGPAASALYGIRGQYGVIMITTKKGKKGPKKVNVQLNSAFSIEKAGNFFPLQNIYGGGSKQTWNTLSNGEKVVEVGVDESWGPKMDGTMVRQVFSFYPLDPTFGQLTPFVGYPNNIEDYYRTGSNSNQGIVVTGGNENSTFRISFNDTRIRGVEPNSWLRRNNFGLSAGMDLTSKLNASVNFTYATNSAQRPSQGSEHGARYMVQWFQRSVDMKRLKDYKFPDGSFVNWNIRPIPSSGIVTDFRPRYWNNPYFEAYENPTSDSRDRIFGDVGLTYQILTGLKVSGFVRGDIYTQNIEEKTAFFGRRVPAYTAGKYHNKEMNYELLAQYTRTWDDLSVDINAGGNIYKRKYTEVYGATAGGLISPGYYSLGASVDRPTISSYLLRKEIRSLYAMASFGYKNTYFIDASLRNDNSSALPLDNNSYWYPSVSGSFAFSELMKWKPLSFGKIRLSYAKAGSDLSPYETSFVYAQGTVYTPPPPASSIPTLSVPDNLANPNIQPSFANSYEAGIDLQFFKNRLGIDFTYYVQKNKNQIIKLDVSGSSGYASTTINAGLIQNKGIELTLTGSPVKTKNFSWDIVFNISRNKSMIVELYPGTNVYVYGSTTYSSVTSFLNSYVGQPFGSLVGKAYQRDPATGQILLDTTTGVNKNMPLYTDATHNFGSVLPDLTGGLQNTFRFFGFDLGIMIDYQSGGQFFSRTKMLLAKAGEGLETAAINDKGKNVRDPIADGGGVHVTGLSVGTKLPVDAYVDARQYYTRLGTHLYEEWIYDASYIKLREVRLGYSFPKKMLGRLPVNNVTLALIARNPVMIWQKAPKGLDPSELSTGGQSISWYESGQANTVRSWGLNLNVNF